MTAANRWSPVRFARQSALGHRRGQTLTLVAVAALITACTAFAPVYDRAMQQALVDTRVAQASPDGRVVTVQSEARVNAGGATEARDPRDLQAMVPTGVAELLGPPVLGRTAAVTTVTGEVPPTGPLVWREGACEHVRVLSGTCPDAAGEILVSDADVENFGLTPGSTPAVAPGVEPEEPDDPAEVQLEVVGTYEPRDAVWWQGLPLVGLSGVSKGSDPSAAHDAWLTTEETFLEAPILPGETSQTGALVPAGTTGVDEMLALGDRVAGMTRDFRSGGEDVYVVTQVGDLVDDLRSQIRLGHRTVPLLIAPMAVLTLFVLWLVLATATEQRRGQVVVARLRGRGPRGAVGLLLVELLPVLLVGVVLGVVAAVLGGAATRALLPGSAPFEAGPGFTAAVLLAVSALVLTTVAAAVRVAREPLDRLMLGGRAPAKRWALGPVDAFLIAGVGMGVLAFATGSLSGSFALAGPALLALLVGLVLAHVAAPAASAGGRRLLFGGRLVAGLSLLDVGRRRETRSVVVVITVACALAVFSLDALAVGARNRVNASQHDAGAPVVLRVSGLDLDGVRAALGTADATGQRATPVMVARNTLAVEPEGFRHIAFFPRGAPTAEEWRAIAAPDEEPVTLSGSRVSLDVETGADLISEDALGDASEVRLGLVVATRTGTLRSIPLGTLPPPGERATLVGDAPECATGCRLAAVELGAASVVDVDGGLVLSDLRVDDRPVDWAASAADWNVTDDDDAVIRPLDGTSAGTLRLLLSLRGNYPAQLTPAWVPPTVTAILPAARDDGDPGELTVTGLDGSDRRAEAVGRVVLVPAMPRLAALVDLDAVSRGSSITPDAHIEVWLVDDPDLLVAVESALGDQGIAVEDVRRHAVIRQAYDDTVATWSLALGAAVGPAVILIALLVLLVLAVSGWRGRARDLAVLRLNGAPRRTTRRLAVWAQLPAIVLAVAAGIAAGLAGAALAIPDVSFFPAAPEAPVVDPSTAWTAVLWTAGTCALVLLVAAATTGWAVARQAHLERVKETVT